jgi:two-component system, NtrC family, response regulator AtoC
MSMAHVLVVDDDASIRALLRLALEDEGHAVREAADGTAALAMLRGSAEPLVVVLDLMMPRLGGAEALAAVAADAELAARHTYLLVTANVSLALSRHMDLLRQLSVLVVPKPFDVDALLAAVSEAASRLAKAPSTVAVTC